MLIIETKNTGWKTLAVLIVGTFLPNKFEQKVGRIWS